MNGKSMMGRSDKDIMRQLNKTRSTSVQLTLMDGSMSQSTSAHALALSPSLSLSLLGSWSLHMASVRVSVAYLLHAHIRPPTRGLTLKYPLHFSGVAVPKLLGNCGHCTSERRDF